ncbi:MAG: WD40 repeat domain-containing protein [Planctomycetes bacterium]|nr:WD40 repeat domain-containing protein [Planctomycetota bacterium]
MPEPLTFRSRCDTSIFTVLAFIAVVAGNLLVNLDFLKHLPREGYPVGTAIAALVIACVVRLAAVLALSRETILVDDEGLTRRWLFGTRRIAWHEVQEAKLPWGGLFWPPAIQLRLDRPKPKFWSLSRGEPRWFAFGDDYEGFPRLLGEVLARVPHATLSANLRAYLRAPNEVAWRHRLPALLTLTANVGALCWLLGLMLSGSASARSWVEGAAVLALLSVFPMVGGALGREWRWKPSLVTVYGLAVPATCSNLGPSASMGRGETFLLLAAGCLACAIATLLICLPWRPRAWQAIVLYSGVAAALLGWTHWRAGVEPFAFGATEVLRPGPSHVAWSADGRWVCGISPPRDGGRKWVCYVVDSRSLAVRSFPIPHYGYWHVMPNARRVFYRDWRAVEGEGKSLCHELWTLDTARGEVRRLHGGPELSLSDVCALSPDHGQLVFVAGPERGKRAVHVVGVDDLSVRKLDVHLDFARASRALWRSDGQLLLVEEPAREDRDKTVVFWAVPPDGRAPTCLYRKASARDNARVSPNGRWAIVWTEAGVELVDLLSGKCRTIKPCPGWTGETGLLWSPDGDTLAFQDRDERTFVVVKALTGEVSRPYTAPDGVIELVALSKGARYALCTVLGDLGVRARIIDVASGRARTLRRWMSLGESLLGQAYWSPAETLLEVTDWQNVLAPEQPVRFGFYQVE